MYGLRIASALLALGLACGASAGQNCFTSRDWHGWSAPNEDTIYLKVGMHDVYRLDLSVGSPLLRAPGMHLVSEIRGPDMVCNALDLDLRLADQFNTVRDPLIVKAITKLTPEEIKAIPEKYQP